MVMVIRAFIKATFVDDSVTLMIHSGTTKTTSLSAKNDIELEKYIFVKITFLNTLFFT
ncbi:hypothetical protein J41TS12_30670 [Paenibacillus antibioticophila]|uniref:Uncharacterized protein n=1 Tax=Paenibacillus antibioticophila TaxID=1274374 RepID=A0A919XTL3_9BACL|nr:hypothetical protein J41TS12_30670 [Paenibacillus antibioticophila]